MYVINITNGYNDLINCKNNENEDINIIIKYFFLSIQSSIRLLCLFSLIIWTMLEPLKLTNNGKFLYPTHPVRCIITGLSCCGKSVFLTLLILNIINENDKINA